MKRSCGCTSCTGSAGQSGISNRPGLSALAYRAGTYDSFFAAMKERLSSADFSFPPAAPPLRSLKTRDQDDPAIALLDAWSVVGDILTFYQERLANEGYLRTATERASIAGLSALVGAGLRPGVSASTYLAYTIDPAGDSTILAGSKVQSVPGPGALPQTFETSEDLSGSGVFSAMVPRLTQPQIPAVGDNLYLAGITNSVNPNDPILLNGAGLPRRVATVVLDAPKGRTVLTMQGPGAAEQAAAAVAAPALQPHVYPADKETTATAPGTDSDGQKTAAASDTPPTLRAVISLLPSLLKPPATHPATALDLKQTSASVYQPTLDTVPKIVRALNPSVSDDLYPALAASPVAPLNPTEVYAFRVKAPVYGHNAPLKPITNAQGIVTGSEEWPLAGTLSIVISIAGSSEDSITGTVLKRFERTDDATESFIKITQGSTSAMAPFTSADKSVSVGGWKVEIDGNLSSATMTFSITDLKRAYKITHSQGKPYQVTTDSFTLSAQENESTSLDSNGRHLSLSIKTSLVITDDSPAALPTSQLNVVSLDAVYDKIVPGSLVYIERADNPAMTKTVTVTSVVQVSLNSYNIPARVSQLTLSDPWLDGTADTLLTVARNTTVYAQSALLPLAEEPITDPIAGDTIEMGALYSDLQPGRWLIVSGERADISGVSGVQDAELVMLASVKQGVQEMLFTPGTSSPVATSTGTASAGGSTPPANTTVSAAASGAASTGSASVGTAPAMVSSPGDSTPDSTSASPSGSGTASTGSTLPSGTTPPSSGTAPPSSGSTPPTPTPVVPTVNPVRPGESTHSYLQLANPLAYTYKRDTVKIYGNVVAATNGETRKEVIGSGDSSQSFQAFALHASPLTYTSAATPSGVASSLAVYVNGIQWEEADSFADCGPNDRCFITSTDEADKTTVTFGDGVHGMRLPTGAENVQAVYRVGIGRGGNLDVASLTILSTKPLGAKAVTNPIISSGGADRDSTEDGRRNAPLASIALDRLVSVSDYASFARAFAGIGKATSALLPIGNQRTVAVTVTGAKGSELAQESQVIQQLTQAFQELGDPSMPVDVLVADPLLLTISARIKTLPDYPWTTVAPLVQAALFQRFSFDFQSPGETVYLSAITSTIQQVAGVAYVVIDGLDTISRSEVDSAVAFRAKLAQLSTQKRVPSNIPLQLEHIDENGDVRPSEVAYLSADVPDTVLLTEIPS